MSQSGRETKEGEKRVGASLDAVYWEKWNRLMAHWRWNQRISLEHMIDQATKAEFGDEEQQQSA